MTFFCIGTGSAGGISSPYLCIWVLDHVLLFQSLVGFCYVLEDGVTLPDLLCSLHWLLFSGVEADEAGEVDNEGPDIGHCS